MIRQITTRVHVLQSVAPFPDDKVSVFGWSEPGTIPPCTTQDWLDVLSSGLFLLLNN